MGIEELLRHRKREILAIAATHGASNIRVFGSVARGEAGPDSDVDLLVDLEHGRSLLDHAALKVELEQLLKLPVEVATERGLKPTIREHILREAVPL
ncbi:MAG: nucleotidyltransferase family protein [Acidobacteriota bacterium]